MVGIKNCIYGIMAAFLFSGSAFAQGEGEGATLVVKDKKVERLGDELRLNMRFVLDSIDLARSKTLVCTPVVVSGDSLRPLRQVIINGRDRHILYGRLDREGSDAIELRRRNGEPQSVDYEVRLPYADWMEQSEVALVMDDCGCGWETLTSNRSTLFEIDLKPVVLNPMMVYVTPMAERVKARSMAGSAFLDFRVNRTEIDPEYRNNPAELAKIRRTIEAVKENKFASITGVVIKGYASPEGSYQSNARLAEGRAKALLEYVKKQYDFGDASLKVESVPEDWEGLEKAVEASDVANKVELLAIIRADEPADWDAREWKLKQLNGGAPYRVLLNEIYPALRHSDYEVDYTIRNFNLDEACELAFTDPSQLSLNEFFMVAQSLEPGSPKYSEVFETAVRMYPDDPVSNLNAAITAIQEKRFDKARGYLAKANDCPEKRLAEAALAMHEGDLNRAESLLATLTNEPTVGATAKANLQQIQEKKRKENR